MNKTVEYFDTHVHLDRASEDGGLDGIMERAFAAGVRRMIAVGGNEDGNKVVLKAVERWPDNVQAAIGWDRDQAVSLKESITGAISRLRDQAGSNRQVFAIGEIGLDFHYHPESRVEQMALFHAQLDLACEMGLPVIVHSRDAELETRDELSRHCAAWQHAHAGRSPGVLHCFTGSREFAEAMVTDGYYISFSGIITFRNAEALREVVRVVPEDLLLAETDTPYLAPEPVRGKPNEPANIRYVVETIARCRGVAVEQIADMVFGNAERLIGKTKVFNSR